MAGLGEKRNFNPEAGRVWFITDTHFGVRNSSNEWIEIIRDYLNGKICIGVSQ